MQWRPSQNAQLLAPFDHQVAGQSSMLVYDETTLCKPLIPREHFVYQNLPAELEEFTPQYRGEILVKMLEKDGHIQLVGQPVGSGTELDYSHEGSEEGSFTISGSAKPVAHLENGCHDNSRCDHQEPVHNGAHNSQEECPMPSSISPCPSQNGPATVSVSMATTPSPISQTATKTRNLNPWSLKNHKRLLEKMKKSSHRNDKTRFMLLGNVVAGFKRPCILDLKIGSRLHGDDASSTKVASQTSKCQQTTSSSLGVRLCGMQVYQLSTGTFLSLDKYHGRTLTAESLCETLRGFLHNGLEFRQELLQPIISRLAALIACVRGLVTYRFYASSLLIMYDGEVAQPDRASSPLPGSVEQSTAASSFLCAVEDHSAPPFSLPAMEQQGEKQTDSKQESESPPGPLKNASAGRLHTTRSEFHQAAAEQEGMEAKLEKNKIAELKIRFGSPATEISTSYSVASESGIPATQQQPPHSDSANLSVCSASPTPDHGSSQSTSSCSSSVPLHVNDSTAQDPNLVGGYASSSQVEFDTATSQKTQYLCSSSSVPNVSKHISGEVKQVSQLTRDHAELITPTAVHNNLNSVPPSTEPDRLLPLQLPECCADCVPLSSGQKNSRFTQPHSCQLLDSHQNHPEIGEKPFNSEEPREGMSEGSVCDTDTKVLSTEYLDKSFAGSFKLPEDPAEESISSDQVKKENEHHMLDSYLTSSKHPLISTTSIHALYPKVFSAHHLSDIQSKMGRNLCLKEKYFQQVKDFQSLGEVSALTDSFQGNVDLHSMSERIHKHPNGFEVLFEDTSSQLPSDQTQRTCHELDLIEERPPSGDNANNFTATWSKPKVPVQAMAQETPGSEIGTEESTLVDSQTEQSRGDTVAFSQTEHATKAQSLNLKVDVRMIDFAHTTHAGFVSDKIRHSGPDEDYILGLENLKALFEQLQAEGEKRWPVE